MERHYQCEVAVIGGGVAGVGAALGAAIAGAETILIERNPYLGGIGTHSGVPSLCGFYSSEEEPRQIVGGVGQTVLDYLKQMGESVEPELSVSGRLIINYDPEALKYVLDQVTADYGVRLLLEARLIGAEQSEGSLKKLVCADDEGLFTVEAETFVDATGDGAAAHLAGHPTEYGDRDGNVQMATLQMRLGGVSRDFRVTQDEVETALCRAREAGFGPMTKMRAPVWTAKKGDIVSLTLPNFELRNLDSESLTEAACKTRELAQVYARALREFLPGMERSFLLATGPRIGIRESRRIVCRRLLTTDQAMTGKDPLGEAAALAGWPLEMHDRLETVSTNRELKGISCYEIPLGCLKARDLDNLWCGGRDIYVDHEVLASARVMGTGFATGQAAGAAAALTGRTAGYDAAAIRTELIRQGAIL